MMQRTFHLKALINSELHGVTIVRRWDPSSTDLSATLNGESVTLITEAGGEEVAFGVLDLRAAPRPVKAGETLILVVDDPAESIHDGWASEYRPRTFSPEAEEAEFPPAWEIREIRESGGGEIMEIMGDDEGTTVVTVISREMASTGRLELDPQVLPGFPEARPGQVLTRTEADVKWGDVSSVFPIYLSGPEKNVSQPLDPVDFPVVQYADDLQPGGVARVESEIKYRRPDGTLVSLGGGGGGLNAVINEEGYYESTDGPEDQPATMTNAELIAAVTEQLNPPPPPTQEQVDAAVTPEMVEAAVARLPISISQEQVNAAVTPQAVELAVTQEKVNQAMKGLVNSGQPVIIEGLKYALPDAQTVDAQSATSLSELLTSSRVSAGSADYDLMYASRSWVSPFPLIVVRPNGVIQGGSNYRFGTAVSEEDARAEAVSMTLSGLHGKVVRQEFAFPAPFATDRILLQWGRYSGASGYTTDSVYTIRLYGPDGALMKTWASVNLRGRLSSATGETEHALDAEMTLTSGALEIEVVSLTATTKVGGGSTFYDINVYPRIATIPLPVRGTSPAATLSGSGVIKSSSDEPMALASPTARVALKPIAPSVITGEGAAVRVQTRGQRLHANLPSAPRPAGRRRFIVIFTLQPQNVMWATSLKPQIVGASLEDLRGGLQPQSIGPISITRQSGSETFTLAGNPVPSGTRLRLECTVVKGYDGQLTATFDYYNDQTGVKVATTSAQMPAPNSEAKHPRLIFSPGIDNSSIHAVDDLLIHRWTEWTE